jgi:pyruvate formate lyase activating enzyme
MLLFSEGWSIGRDGTGQRLTLHLKGCNMRCAWCANPEGIAPQPQTLFLPRPGAPRNDAACPYGALSGDSLDRARCRVCESRACALSWRDRRFELCGTEASVAEILGKALKAKHLFGKEGGVTFGGGEPTLQRDELLEALRELKRLGVGTAIESNASTPAFLEAAALAEQTICDLKTVNREAHKRATGLDNAQILDNLRCVAESVSKLLIRIPLVPGVNASPEDFEAFASFCGELSAKRAEKLGKTLKLEILRLHHLGQPKRLALGETYEMAGVKEPSRELALKLAESLRKRGIEVSTT